MTAVQPIAEVLGHFGVDVCSEQGRSLHEALVAREDAVADVLRLAGAQFGLHAPIVAEVMAEVGLGTPLSEEARQMVHSQFIAHMEELRRRLENGEDI